MGRFIREQCAREGVDTRGIVTDPQRLTALVILGIRDSDTFPLIFYRENCADAALVEGDIDEGLLAEAAAVLVTGTHFSSPQLDAASRRAIGWPRRMAAAWSWTSTTARPLGPYRPRGSEARFVASDRVTGQLRAILPQCDLIVGTEEEMHLAGGTPTPWPRCARCGLRRRGRSSWSSAGRWAVWRFLARCRTISSWGSKARAFRSRC